MADARLADLLNSLSLGKFVDKFKEEDVDYDVAKGMSVEEFAELGLTIGARKKLHAALNSGEAPAASSGGSSSSSSGASSSSSGSSSSSIPSSGGSASWDKTVTSANQFKWKNEGEKYPESGETRGDCMWCPDTADFKHADLVTCQGVGNFLVWDRASGQVSRKISSPNHQRIACVKAGDLEILATGAYSQPEVTLFNLANGQQLVKFEKMGGLSVSLVSMSFLPTKSKEDVKLLATADDSDPKIRLFDLGTGQVAGTWSAPYKGWGFVKADVLNHGLFYCCTRNPDGKVHLCDTRSGGGIVRSFLGGKVDAWGNIEPNPISLAGPSDRRMVGLFNPDILKVWDVGTGKSMMTMSAATQAAMFKYGGVMDTALVGVRRDASAHVWIHNGGDLPDDKPADFTLENSELRRNSPSVYAAAINNNSIFVGGTTGILEGYWTDAPKRAW